MLEKTISEFIEQHFPAIYREEGPFFVEFMKQYYVWLESEVTSPVYQSRKYLEDHNIDTTVDDFIIYFKEKYLKNIQFNTATNTKQLIKNSINLYRSKGTENAINLFFDLIFSAPVEIYYPGNDVFKLSDAEWVIPQYLEVTSKPINRLLVGRGIVGLKSGATAFVERLVRRKIKNSYIEVLYISANNGDFQTGEIIKIVNSETATIEFPTIIGSLSDLNVSDGGTGFAKGDVVELTSRTGINGKAIVDTLNSVTGLVDFELEDGGWGYTSNSVIRVSNNVLILANAALQTSDNRTLYDKISVVYQPMANVQWYANTTDFSVGDVVYNYYANGVTIGSSVIISAEYGTSNTTNYFLLNNLSGNTYMDPAAPMYYTVGNTHSFTVQNGGHVDVTATANVVGLSNTITLQCTGNSSFVAETDTVYQISSNNVVYAEALVANVNSTGVNKFDIVLTDIEGLFLTNDTLKNRDNTSANITITSAKLDIGVIDISNSFKVLDYNKIFDNSNNSLFSATITNIPFGSGASVDFDTDLVNTETVMLNTNYLRDHIDESVSSNWINAVSYGASLNNSSLNTPVLGDALQFTSYTIGTIARLVNENPGADYTSAPIVQPIDPLIAPLAKMYYVIRIDDATGVYSLGERVTQSVNGASGIVKFANTSEVHIKRLNFEEKWAVGVANSYLIVGQDSGFTSLPTEVTFDNDGVAGKNAIVSANVVSSTSAVKTLKLTDSGFGFLNNDTVSFTSEDGLRSGTAVSSVTTSGIASGFYSSSSSFLSGNKRLYDGDYYQDFSYEIKSPITVSRYSDMLKEILHVSGTKAFSSILNSRSIDSKSSLRSTSVLQTQISPGILFLEDEAGLWYDPNDLSTMYQDSAGTTAAAVDQPVGLILDKSKQLARGSNLIENNEFNDSTGWTLQPGWTVSTGKLRATSITAFATATSYTLPEPMVAGKTYEILFDIESITGTFRIQFAGGATLNGSTFTTSGSRSEIIVATAAHTTFALQATVGPASIVVDNVYVREIPGNHARQTTTASKPVLRHSNGLYYLEFDGVDDFLVTNNMDLTGTDAVSVFAGVRKLSDTTTGMALEFSADINSNNGAFRIGAPIGVGSGSFEFSSKGSVVRSKIRTGFATPITAVLTGTADISGDTVNLRVNGTNAAAVTGDQGTGNYGNYPLYIGRRGGTTLPFNGHIYTLVVRGASTTDADVDTVEQWVSRKTGVTL